MWISDLELLSVFGTGDNILFVGYDDDGTDHDRILGRKLQIWRKENLKLKKCDCHFRCTGIPFWEQIIFLIIM